MTSHITITDANIVTKPELRMTPSGQAVCNFRIAANKNVKNKQTGEWEKGAATFLTCTAWGQRAERIHGEDFEPGDLIHASGSFELEEYEKDGIKRVTGKVNLDSFGRDLKWLDKPKQDTARNTGARGTDNDEEPPF